MTLPLIKPTLIITTVLNVIYVFNSFPIIWVMTEGGPAYQTDILVTFLYKKAFREGQFGMASAIAVLVFLICSRSPSSSHGSRVTVLRGRRGSRS